MGFNVVTPQRSFTTPAVPHDGVVVSTFPAPKTSRLYARFEIGLGCACRAELADGNRVELAWGTGPDWGKLRVREAPQGQKGFQLNQDKRRTRLAFTVANPLLPADFADARMRRLRCPVEVVEPTREDDWPRLVVTLPRGFLERVSYGEA